MKITFGSYWHKTKRTGMVKTESWGRDLDVDEAFRVVAEHAKNTGELCGLVWDGDNVSLGDALPLIVAAMCDGMGRSEVRQEESKEKLKDDIVKLNEALTTFSQDCKDMFVKLGTELNRADEENRNTVSELLEYQEEVQKMRREMSVMRQQMTELKAMNKGLTDALPLKSKRRSLRKDSEDG